jgi:EmrB/QacA subfamily drug resistance transporter
MEAVMANKSAAAGPPAGGPANAATPLDAVQANLGMIVVLIGVLITAIDGTVVVLALPAMQRDLHVSLSSVIWVIVGYLLVLTVLSTQVGRLGDIFGRVRMYEAGFGIFVLGSFLCALSWDTGAIIGFRIVQAIGGALVTANSGAVISDLFPPDKRGRAYGYNAMCWSSGALLGVLLGGIIVTYISWRWIFWINVPIGIVALGLAFRVLRERGQRTSRHLDVPGMIALGLGLFGVLWAMTELATQPLDATTIGYLVGGVIMLIAFVLIEIRQREPVLDLSLFKIPTVAPALGASLFQGLGSFSLLFLAIMYLQGPRELTPIHASLVMVPGYAVGAAVGPFAGRLTDRFGAVVPATAGLALQAVALLIFAQMTLTTTLWLPVIGNVVNMLGGALFYPANSAAVMKSAPPARFGIASGVLRTFASIGMVFSFTTVILIASHSVSRSTAFAIFVGTATLHGALAKAFTDGLHSAFYSMVAIMAVAAVLSAIRGRFNTAATQSAAKPQTTAAAR